MRLAKAGLAAALALLALEVILRLTLYRFASYPKSPGPGQVYSIGTTEFKTSARLNSLNIRDEDIPPKPPRKLRVLCLGDSFTFGLGVDAEHSYPRVLDRLIKAAVVDRPSRVINAATGGGPRDALGFLKKTGLGLKPDIVIEQLYIGNDFYDGIDEQGARSPGALDASGLRVVDLAWNLLIRIPEVDRLLFRLNLRYANRGIYLKKHPALEKRLVAAALSALKEMASLCRARGIRLIVLVVPDKAQLLMRPLLDRSPYDSRKPNRLIAEFCAREGIELLDLTESYEAMPLEAVRSLYYVRDLHWTAAGARHAAEQLAPRIIRPATRGR